MHSASIQAVEGRLQLWRQSGAAKEATKWRGVATEVSSFQQSNHTQLNDSLTINRAMFIF